MTVDYERGNFSVSQCLWNDGADSEITSIISPTYQTNNSDYSNNSSSNSPPPSSKAASVSKKHLSAGAIAGIVIAVLATLALTAGLTHFLLRPRRQHSPSSSKHKKVPSEDINLANVNKDQSRPPTASPAFPAPVYKKDSPDETFYGEGIPRIELPAGQQEIYQLPAHDNREGDYFTAAREMRAASTPEVEGSARYELPGSEPDPSGLDDEISRSRSVLAPKWSPGLFDQGVSPDFPPPRTPDTTRGSPRVPSPMSPLSPWSDFSEHGC